MSLPRPAAGLVLLGLLAVPLAARAADPPPIPFDAKKALALRERERAWLLESTFGAYRKVGKHGPKWDGLVEQAMKANVERVAGPDWMRISARDQVADLTRKALDAGCDDPLVRYTWIRTRRKDSDATTKRDYLIAAQALAASEYPDIRKAHAWLNAVAELQFAPSKQAPAAADLKAAGECLDELLKLLAVLAKDRANRSLRKEVFELCQLVHRNGNDIGRRKEWFDRLDREVLAKLPKDDPLRNWVAGAFLFDYAWDTRRGRVDAPGFEKRALLFRERLTEADERLLEAWERDKQNAKAAALQIAVCTRLGYDRNTMEVWFRRAVEADPTDVDAFFNKANYLQPWHGGSREEILAFARQVVKLGRWDTTLPLVLTQVHYDLGAESGNFVGYFRDQPEVWTEIEPVLEEVRKRYPESPLGASQYLYFAWRCNRNPAQAHGYVGAARELAKGPFRKPEETNAAREWAAEGASKAKKK